ncbi:MAG: hypothetical protein M3O50_21240, partial [Myxococcota bacterium]|nr:hypothetical protein [Myxococcota bacterium]
LAVTRALFARHPTASTAAKVVSAVGLCALALAPFTACAVIRTVCWGHPAPLALLAKPSDLAHGLAYAGAAWVVTLTPLLVLAPLALRRAPAALAIVAAAVAHGLAVIVVGGDWMPYARLMVPVAPSLAYAGVLVSTRAGSLGTAARSVAGLALGAALLVRGGAGGRRVGLDRGALVAAARPLLAGVPRVAALDIGWVSAATEADIVDLAGLTDPDVAALPGGHTSKRVDPMFLLSRHPDALLLYAHTGSPGGARRGGVYVPADAEYTRAVEARLARDPVITRHFVEIAWLPLGGAGAGYALLRRVP